MSHPSALFCLAFLFLFLFFGLVASNPTVTTTYGPIEGFSSESVDQFLGVPFAKPPVGPLRFQNPVPPEPWTETLKATSFRSKCFQPADVMFPPHPADEDCLYLNVYTPAGSSQSNDAKLPVLVWIHGGGYTVGNPINYPGDSFVRRAPLPVIVVTVAYRVGPLGFFNHPSVQRKEDETVNFGFSDQQLALQWVQYNIEAFGGDPSRVTIFGESAGGGSVAVQLTWPSSWPLFHRAILQSPFSSLNFLPRETSQERANIWASSLGCKEEEGKDESVIECLRRLPAQAFLATKELEGFWNLLAPIVDEVSVLGQLPHLFEEGAQPSRPHTNVIVGTNQYEGALFSLVFTGSLEMNEEQYEQILTLAGIPQASLQDVRETYQPFIDSKGYWEAFKHLSGDFWINCGAKLIANSFGSSSSSSTIWKYFLTREVEKIASPLNLVECTHADDIPFVFGSFHNTTFTEDERKLSNKIIAYWSNFAAYGNPNGDTKEDLEWPAYKTDTRANLVLDFETRIETSIEAEERCARLWDQVFKKAAHSSNPSQAPIDNSVLEAEIL